MADGINIGTMSEDSVKLQKYIADAGICSRRAAERLIYDGEVTVNGIVAKIGDRVTDGDTVAVRGREVKRSAPYTYIMLNKPAGVVTTMSDENGRRCVADLVTDVNARIYPVGRLDMYSDGLLILTDDGETANMLSHPGGGKEKIYRVVFPEYASDDKIESLRQMRTITDRDGREQSIMRCDVDMLSRSTDETVVQMTLYEGRNRQIRRMCDSVGLKIKRLTRISYGGIELGDLPCGKWRYLTNDEVETLRSRRHY